MLFWIIYVLAWIPVRILFPLKVVGKKNLPKSGGVVLCCNHFSNFDVILLQAGISRRMYYLVKKELMKNKFFAWFLRKMGAFSVDRGAGDLAATKFALGKLKQGKPMCLFPEGTRNKESEELQALKSGSVLFSAKTNSPLVPMMILKRPRVFSRNVLVIGEPVEFGFAVANKPSKEELEQATQTLAEKMTALQKENLPRFYKQKANN